MPRTPKAKPAPTSDPSSDDKKPYTRDLSSTPPPGTPTRRIIYNNSGTDDTPSKIRKRAGGPVRAWAAEDLIAVFDVATKSRVSVKEFDGAVEGRTGAQCYSTWNNTIAPYILKMLEEKAKGGKAK